MATFKLSEFDDMKEAPARIVRSFKMTRLLERERLQKRLDQMPKWAKRLEVLKDPVPETVIDERLKTLMNTCVEQGLSFRNPKAYTNTFDGHCNTIYTKDKVKIKNLSSEFTTYPDGSVCIDVYKLSSPDPKDKPNTYYWYHPSAKDKVIRIFVSDTVRITNNVLRTLIS